ncbi:MAG: hypothetical protein R3343_01270 [Nitriliruptorales bacterium]|nr:hypothetical protein [Nitriliruptorales bacterium]
MVTPLRRSTPVIAATIVALLATACSGGDEAAQPDATDTGRETPTETVTATETETVTQTETETETATETETETATETGEAGGDEQAASDPAQDFVVSPQEPITTSPSDPHDQGGDGVAQFTVAATYDGEIPAGFTLGFVPCRSVLGSDGPGVAFQGLPEAMGHTDEDHAFVYSIEGERAEPGPASSWPRFVAGDDDGELTFSLNAERPDCAAPIVWVDSDDDGQLDLNDSGQPTERYGYGKVTWES